MCVCVRVHACVCMCMCLCVHVYNVCVHVPNVRHHSHLLHVPLSAQHAQLPLAFMLLFSPAIPSLSIFSSGNIHECSISAYYLISSPSPPPIVSLPIPPHPLTSLPSIPSHYLTTLILLYPFLLTPSPHHPLHSSLTPFFHHPLFPFYSNTVIGYWSQLTAKCQCS